ncbi:MAG: DUF2794 domain-containing protein [Proteobacteria bacterium]|nr:DUF2794 domain-containing protein [Pseudomonadota bacterium]
MARTVFFDRSELSQILSVYSRKVISGEWCDYGIEGGDDEVAFAIFRRNAVSPAYRIIKRRRGREAGRYRVVAVGGRILKVGPSLRAVLGVLDPKHLRLI